MNSTEFAVHLCSSLPEHPLLLQWFSPCLAVKLFTEKAEVWGKGVGALCEAKDFNCDSVVLALAFV